MSFQAYVNCIDELAELKIYKSADEEIDEVIWHSEDSDRIDTEQISLSQLCAQACLQPEYFAQYQSEGVYFQNFEKDGERAFETVG